jgi:hypothetical protein
LGRQYGNFGSPAQQATSTQVFMRVVVSETFAQTGKVFFFAAFNLFEVKAAVL